MAESFDDIFGPKSETKLEENTTVATPEIETIETVEEPVETEKETVETTEEKPEAETVTEPQKEEQTRDDKGRFAAPEPQVPLAALRTVRERAQTAEARAADLEKRLREVEDQQRQNIVPPQPWDDPEGFQQHVVAEAERRAEQRALAILAQREAEQQQRELAELSKNLTAVWDNYAPEDRDAIMAYAMPLTQADPNFAREVLAQSDPIEFLRDHSNRQAQEAAMLEEIRRDPDAFALRRAAELSAAAAQAAPVTQPQMAATAKASRSLASAGTSTVSTTAKQAGEEGFDAIFNTKR